MQFLLNDLGGHVGLDAPLIDDLRVNDLIGRLDWDTGAGVGSARLWESVAPISAVTIPGLSREVYHRDKIRWLNHVAESACDGIVLGDVNETQAKLHHARWFSNAYGISGGEL